MFDEIFHNEFQPNFIYLIESSLKYDHELLTLQGNFHYKNSPYLLVGDKIMNNEDTVFIMAQSLQVFFAFYYQVSKKINAKQFRKDVFNSIIVTKTIFEFFSPIKKEIDENNFLIKLLNSRMDSKNRFWFNFILEMSNGKHLCKIDGCILNFDFHKGP